MRSRSKKFRDRAKEAKPFRDALIDLVGECEISGHSPARPWPEMPKECSELCVHEIACGPHRQKALDQAYAVLVLSNYANQHMVTDKSEWPEARQLAVLAKSRPLDFNLEAYLKLTSPKAMHRIEIEEVIEWMDFDYLTKQDVATRLQVDRRAVQNWIESLELAAIDVRTVGSSKPLYRIPWDEYLAFCKRRAVKKD